jgi:hypothetical protein
MRKLIALFLLAAVGASAQVTNTVNISNSLLGPVTNVFTNTQINVGEAIITGAVFNASVTNTFSPSITNEISVGAVSVTNNITNDISVTNIIENIAVAVTNTVNITNITQTFVTTSGVSSINGEEGAITFEGSGVTQTGTVFNFSGGGGGTGNIEINGVTTNAFTFVGQFPVSVSNIANTFYFGQLGGGTFIPAAGTNQVLNFVGSVTQTFTVPSGVTQLYVYAWGAGGGGGSTTAGGAGGYSFGYFNVTTGEVLSVVIGEGGFVSSATASTAVFTNTLNPFPNGGWGASRHTGRAGAGGGSTAILRGTNFLVVAGGGGGGGVANAAGGGGGGTSGQSGFGTAVGLPGGGGTQDAGGAAGSTATALSITNSAGTFGLGGNSGLTTNANVQAAGGGGGGYYGGGGSVATTVNAGGGGGGGSGHINTSEGVIGTTVQAQTPAAGILTAQPPPATDDPLYGSPSAATWGRGGATTAAGSNGGMIIRWVEP